MTRRGDYDAVIVGASLAGCTTAILLARAGARVALIEQRPDAAAFKRICTHYIQSSAVPTLERLGLLERMMQVGALRGRARMWTRWGWIEPPAGELGAERGQPAPRAAGPADSPAGGRDPRGRADPRTHRRWARARGRLGVRRAGARPQGETLTLRARLIVGADGRDSRVAKLAEAAHEDRAPRALRLRRLLRRAQAGHLPRVRRCGCSTRTWPRRSPPTAAWTFYAVMPSQGAPARVPRRPRGGAEGDGGRLPEAPPILASRLVGEVTGKIDMTTSSTPRPLPVSRSPATPPARWTRCGASVAASPSSPPNGSPTASPRRCRRAESLEQGLERYRRRHARGLRGHTSDDPRLLQRSQAQCRRAAAVLGGHPRRAPGRDLRGVRFTQHRAGADDRSRRCRARCSSTRATHLRGAASQPVRLRRSRRRA